MAKILVVGGAGYVGSAVSAWLLDQGHSVWILDDLSTGRRELVLGQGFTLARAGDREALTKLFRSQAFDAVMHFAARSIVSESFAKRAEYFENNVEQTRVLAETALDHGIRSFVFSSTCAIFGDPGNQVIDEKFPKNPMSPYGESKLAAERMLEELAKERGLQAIALRYFNAAGAEHHGRVGEWHANETHLIPNVLAAALEDREVPVFGTDYGTPDGTCIRDYVHVSDLAQAHEAAALRLMAKTGPGGSFEAFNLGSEDGFSVREIIAQTERAIGKTIKISPSPRRPGDPEKLVADSSLAKRELGFTAKNGIADIIQTAHRWELKKKAPLKAVFLDRDGTMNDDPGYLSRPEQMNLLPGVGDALSRLENAGYLLVVVSNQSGVARGFIEPEMLPKIHARLDELLKPYNVKIRRYELCTHHPDDHCDCRKPKPKLLLNAAQALNLDLAQSFMIGDRASDIEAGKNAGCRGCVLLRRTNGKIAAIKPDFEAKTMADAAGWILTRPVPVASTQS